MKISDLIEKLKEIRLEEGNLEVWLHIEIAGESYLMGELNDMYTEERRTLFLLADKEVISD